MSTYYGVGYRRGGIRLGFQGPYPGRTVPPVRPPAYAPPAPSPGRKPFTIPKFGPRPPMPVRYIYGGPLRLYRYAKLVYKVIEYNWPELLPWTEGKPGGYDIDGYMTAQGYTKYCDIAVIPPDARYARSGYRCAQSTAKIPQNSCGTPLQVPAGPIGSAWTIPKKPCCAFNFQVQHYDEVALGNFTNNGTRMTFTQIWGRSTPTRPCKVEEAYEEQIPYTLPRPPVFLPAVDAPLPGLFPEALPIQKPVSPPLSIPYPLLPLRRDSPWPQGRQTSNGDPQTRAPRPRLTTDPLAGPAVQTDGGALRPAPPHAFVPPRRGDKERKSDPGRAANAVKGFIDGVLGPATEAADVIGAIHDALPKKVQCRKCTPQGQLKAIYDNFDKLDIPQAIINVALNQAQDAAIGYIGKGVKAGSKNRPGGLRPIGFSTGPGL